MSRRRIKTTRWKTVFSTSISEIANKVLNFYAENGYTVRSKRHKEHNFAVQIKIVAGALQNRLALPERLSKSEKKLRRLHREIRKN